MDFAGKTIWITGASSGIGEGLALALQPGAQAGSNGWVACFERPWALAWVDA